MKTNVGKTDKIIRFIIGVAILAIGIYAKSWWGLLGFIPLLTAFIGWCPLYIPFGITTICKCSDKKCDCHDEKKEDTE